MLNDSCVDALVSVLFLSAVKTDSSVKIEDMIEILSIGKIALTKNIILNEMS